MRVTSRQNPFIKHIRRLGADPSYRREQGLFLADGPKLLQDALRSGVVPTHVIAADGLPLPELPGGTEHVSVPPALIGAASPLETPQGILFVCRIPAPPPAPPQSGRWLLLDRLQDPGNVGSILRTAEAFALDGALLAAGCADPFGCKAVRASMGAIFRLPVGNVSRETILKTPLPLYVADIGKFSATVDTVDYSACVVALGSEGQGIDPVLRARADTIISIPMGGGAESLGVAAAAAVICWEMCK